MITGSGQEWLVELGRLVEEAAARSAATGEHVQVWFYIQVERGRVAQVGMSPVPGVSVRMRRSYEHR